MDAPGFYFCICPDSALARQHVAEFSSILFTDPEEHVFWADEGLDAAFWDKLTMVGFSTRPRIIKLRMAQALAAEDWKKLSARLGVPRTGILPILFLEGSWEKGKPKLPAYIEKLRCLEFARKQDWLWQNPGLTEKNLSKYLQDRAKERQLTLEAGVLQQLAGSVAPDAAQINSIFDQLALLSQTGKVTTAMVDQLATHTPELVIFDLIRKLENGQEQAVWETLLAENDGGDSFLFQLLALLSREARLLWQSLHGNPSAFHAYVAEEKSRLAKRLGARGLGWMLEQIALAEYSVKSGNLQTVQALHSLIAALLRIFSARRPAGTG